MRDGWNPAAQWSELESFGLREPEIYGSASLQSIELRLGELGRRRGHTLSAFQSNAEHELIAKIHCHEHEGIAFVIINPGGYSHTRYRPARRLPFRGRTVSSRCISATCSHAKLFATTHIVRHRGRLHRRIGTHRL